MKRYYTLNAVGIESPDGNWVRWEDVEALEAGAKQSLLAAGLPLPRDLSERLRVLRDAWARYQCRDLSLEELEGAVAELAEMPLTDRTRAQEEDPPEPLPMCDNCGREHCMYCGGPDALDES